MCRILTCGVEKNVSKNVDFRLRIEIIVYIIVILVTTPFTYLFLEQCDVGRAFNIVVVVNREPAIQPLHKQTCALKWTSI